MSQGEETLVVYSLDFSHYLSKIEADIKDNETYAIMSTGDNGKIFELGNNHVDGPVILATAIKVKNELGLEMRIDGHSNSFDLVYEKPSETTSHYSISFRN